MNKLLLALKRRLQWRLLALIEKKLPDDHYPPTDREVKQRLESLGIGEQLELMAVVKGLGILTKLTGENQQ